MHSNLHADEPQSTPKHTHVRARARIKNTYMHTHTHEREIQIRRSEEGVGVGGVGVVNCNVIQCRGTTQDEGFQLTGVGHRMKGFRLV
jgi:hypothetical protein